MRRIGWAAAMLGLVAIVPVQAQRSSVFTPTAGELKRERDEARVTPLAVPVVAAGLALQASGVGRAARSPGTAPDRKGRLVDIRRTDASVVVTGRQRRFPPGSAPKPARLDSALMSAAGWSDARPAPKPVPRMLPIAQWSGSTGAPASNPVASSAGFVYPPDHAASRYDPHRRLRQPGDPADRAARP